MGECLQLHRHGANVHARLLISFAIGITALFQLHLAFVQGINWDEFFFLSQVHLAKNGTLQLALNTIHSRLFSWLTLLPDEIAQVRAARLVMLGCQIVTVGCIIGLARRFSDQSTAMLAGLAYLSGGYVFLHGASFRVDPIATAFLMLALWVSFACRLSLRNNMVVALCLACAGLTTIKSVFFAPAFAGLWFLRWQRSSDRRSVAASFTTAGLGALIMFAILYCLHFYALDVGDMERSRKMVSSAGDKMFSSGLFPQPLFLIKQGLMAPVLCLAILMTPVLIARKTHDVAQRIALIGLWLPLISLAVYRNSFPYFYVFVLAPVAVAASISLSPVVRRYGAIPLALVLFANSVWLYAKAPKDMQAVQASVLHTVHEVFPEPVAYIDFSSMVSSFPKQGFFMSSWGMDNYRDAGRPVFEDIIERQAVPLVIANHDSLDAALRQKSADQPLLPADARILADNYVHYWGPIWLAGKRLVKGVETTSIKITVPGTYTLNGGAAAINGVMYWPGDSVVFEPGIYSISKSGSDIVTLRFGRHTQKPNIHEPKPGRFGVFSDF